MKDASKAFIVYKNKCLWVLRDNNPNISWPNTWNLPGGGIEKQETFEEAIKRELKEEVNLTPKNIIYLGKEYRPEGDCVARFLIYITEKEYHNLKLVSEGQEMKFFNIDEIVTLPLSSNGRKYLEDHIKDLSRIFSGDNTVTSQDLGLIC